MRISKLFALASLTLGTVSALVLPVKRDALSDGALESRDNHPNHGRVSIDNKAVHHMQNVLGLKGHEAKTVEDFHKNTVAAEMQKHGAHSAQIHYLAHTEGSHDPNMHITATLKDKEGKVIPSKYGSPEKTGERHHIYTGALPKEYTDAVHQHKEHLEKDPEAKRKHEARLAQTKAAKEERDKGRAEKKKAQDEAFKQKSAAEHAKGAEKSLWSLAPVWTRKSARNTVPYRPQDIQKRINKRLLGALSNRRTQVRLAGRYDEAVVGTSKSKFLFFYFHPFVIPSL